MVTKTIDCGFFVITDDYFASIWAAHHTQYDTKKNAGNKASYTVRSYCYDVFRFLNEGKDDWGKICPWQIDVSVLPNLGRCGTCGAHVSLNKGQADDSLCPRCSVKRDDADLVVINRRYRRIITAIKGLGRGVSEFASISDRSILYYKRDRTSAYYSTTVRDSIAKTRLAQHRSRTSKRVACGCCSTGCVCREHAALVNALGSPDPRGSHTIYSQKCGVHGGGWELLLRAGSH